jgi:inner membrane protein
MDNVTHTLVGVLLGEAASRILPNRTNGSTFQPRRNLCVFVMAMGSNLPDADLLHTLIAGGRLDYLLHHRGYTHTVIGALVASVAMFAACHVWWWWRRVQPEDRDRAAVAGVALLAPLLHIAMDATNSYGVHPFWPYHNGWLYGDSVFIIEPLFWAAAAPLVFVLRTALARALVGAVLLAGVALSFLVGMVPQPLGVFLVILMLGMLVTGKVTRARTAVLAGVACWLVTTAVFVSAGQLADRRAADRANEDFPTATTLDRILSPMPVNPVCWEVILAQQDGDGDAYVLRRAMLSLAPSWMPAADCPSRSLDARTTAPLSPVSVQSRPALQWYGELVMSRTGVVRLVRQHCQAEAFTRFARALWIARRDGGWWVGDLRFDREPSAGFAELALEPTSRRCPSNVPPWTPPRADILGP